VLADGCAAFSRETHERSIGDLSTLARIMDCADAIDWIRAA
jgi:hypothetical protein